MENPLVLQGLDHVAIRVGDLSRSEAFYCGVLGCAVVRRNERAGIVHMRAGPSLVDLVLDRGELLAAPTASSLHHLCLSYQAFAAEKLFVFLSEQGIAHDGQMPTRFGAEGDGPSVYLRDPDGHMVELKCYGDRADSPT